MTSVHHHTGALTLLVAESKQSQHGNIVVQQTRGVALGCSTQVAKNLFGLKLIALG